MKKRMSVLGLGLLLLNLAACSGGGAADGGYGGGAGPSSPGAAGKISGEPLAGVISGKEWQAGSGVASVVTYSDGTQLLKVEIGSQIFSGCSKPTDFGWTGSVTMFSPITIGLITGDNATVQLQLGGASGSKYAYKNKAIRIDAIDGNQVKGAVYAETEGHEVSGTFTATLCP